jgi:nitroimidazol reductase NimA-like FMN-containing flavoprotein (pyridoxamine 5'-phosphate oxidase superfamily)
MLLFGDAVGAVKEVEMRRSNREIKDLGELLAILDKCDVCRLALCDGDKPYIVPLNFGYTFEDERLTLFFHGAKEGRKLDVIAQNPNACFEMDCSHELLTGEAACDFSMKFESVIGNGRITLCETAEEKTFGLSRVMAKYSPGKTYTFPEPMVRATAVLRLDVTDFTGKHWKKA